MLKWLGGIGEYECVLVGNKSIVIPPYNKSRIILVRYGTILVKFTTHVSHLVVAHHYWFSWLVRMFFTAFY